MLNIDRTYHAHWGNYTAGGNRMKYIVIHNTGNTASARNEARYAANTQHNSSYHYVLDGNECFQILDDDDTAWAVGAWAGARQLIGNNESISIEVVSDGDWFSNAEIIQLRELVNILMSRHGIPAENVVRHYDCHTGHKSCPGMYVNEANWEELWNCITKKIAVKTPEPTGKSDRVDVWYQVLNEDGWTKAVNGANGVAGVDGKPIYGVRISCNAGHDIEYRVHQKNGKWSKSYYAKESNIADPVKGYARVWGQPIDAIKCYLSNDSHTGERAQYRVSPIGGSYWYGYQFDFEEDDGQDGYAGDFGTPIDKFQIF